MICSQCSRQHTDALWGAVYFETSPSEHGVLMRFGLQNTQSALVLLLAYLAICTAIGLIAKAFTKSHAATRTPKRTTR